MILTIGECFDKGVQNFRDRLEMKPHLYDSFISWFNNQHHSLPDFLSHKKPADWLELAGDEAMAKQLLIWFDNLPTSRQQEEASYDIEALLEDNGHI